MVSCEIIAGRFIWVSGGGGWEDAGVKVITIKQTTFEKENLKVWTDFIASVLGFPIPFSSSFPLKLDFSSCP